MPDVETKYEGQRTDRTHAVNGTFRSGDRERTFQCSFNSAGNRIIRFIVNRNAVTQPASGNLSRSIRFPAGAASASVTGRIVGRQSATYTVGAEAGQTMDVSLTASNSATYFNIYQPGKGPGDDALSNSSMSADLNRASIKLPVSGSYTISVYMMRSAARRNERSNFKLRIAIPPLEAGSLNAPVQKDFADGLQGGPDFWEVRSGGSTAIGIHKTPSAASPTVRGVAPGTVLRNLGCRMMEGIRWCHVSTVRGQQVSGWIQGGSLKESAFAGQQHSGHDAKVPGTNFHATGYIQCSRSRAQPAGSCKFGVERRPGGGGKVTIFWPDGGSRIIFYEKLQPASFDRSNDDGDVAMHATRNGDLVTVTIGEQTFQIPDAVVEGG